MTDRIQDFINWLEYEKRYSKHTTSSYRLDLKQFSLFSKDVFDVNDMTEVSSQIIKTWVMQLMDTGLSSRSVNRKLVSLSTFFDFLQKEEVVTTNPVDSVNRPKQSQRLAGFIESKVLDEVLKSENFEESFSGKRNKLLVELMYNTGIRISELIGLAQEDVDFTRSEIKVLGKGSKQRTIPISDSLLTQIRLYQVERAAVEGVVSTTNLFVLENGKPLYPLFINRLFNRIVGAVSSTSRKNPHAVRHSFATHMLNNGSDIQSLKELLGHSSLESTSVYTHNSIERLRDVYKKSHPRK